MKKEIVVTRAETKIIEIETPAYFKSEHGFRIAMLLDDCIIEVGKEICLIYHRDTKYSQFDSVLDKCLSYEKSTKEEYNDMMQSFIEQVYLSKVI